MAKKLCELCQQEPEKDLRFGVSLCQKCLDDYNRALSGDSQALNYFLNEQNFPNATDGAKKHVIGFVQRRVERAAQAKKEQEALRVMAEQQAQAEAARQQAMNITQSTVAYTQPNQYVPNKTESFSNKLDGLYVEIGKKIKNWAKWIFVTEAVMAVIGGLVMLFSAEDAGMVFVAILTMFFGPVLAWVTSWVLYAFGELVDKTCTNTKIMQKILENQTNNINK